jgi:hypothetical protein
MMSSHLRSPSVLEVQDRRDLWNIRRAAFNLAIWRRAAASEQDALGKALRSGVSISVDTLVDHSRSGDALVGAIPDASVHPSFSARWQSDVSRLVVLFGRIAGANRVRLRLETIRGPACRLFHADYVGLRLLCTYTGGGTEYLEEGNANRAALGKGRNADIVRSRELVRRLNTNDVGLFKGGRL